MEIYHECPCSRVVNTAGNDLEVGIREWKNPEVGLVYTVVARVPNEKENCEKESFRNLVVTTLREWFSLPHIDDYLEKTKKGHNNPYETWNTIRNFYGIGDRFDVKRPERT